LSKGVHALVHDSHWISFEIQLRLVVPALESRVLAGIESK